MPAVDDRPAVSATGGTAARPARRPRAARGSHWLLLAGLALVVLAFYGIEASLRKTPWLFTDELEWSQLSRAIASTGTAARRGEPHSFESLYSYLIAPAWWIHSTATAYAAIKFLNVVVMCLTAVPVYLLGRLLLARGPALVVALLSIAIPAMSYTSSIVPESLAYLWYAAGALFAVRLLERPSWGRAVPAVLLAIGGIWVRSEFVALPAALVLAAAIVLMWHKGGALSWGRRIAWVALGAVGLALFAFLFNLVVVRHVQSWTFHQYFNSHTIHEGGLAAGALAIGLGILPVIGGIASLWLPERFDDPAYRAFSGYLLASILALWVYTAAKSTYLLSSLRPAIEERNLFYLSPLLLTGTALVLLAKKVNWPLVAIAAAVVMAAVWSGAFEVGAPYFEAPGLGILTLVNRNFRWDVNDFHRLLGAAALVSIVLLVFRRRRWVPLLAAVLAGAWLLTGQIYATIGNTDEANSFAKKIPAPRNWVDTATGGRGVTFLGQSVTDGNPLWLTEFWNRSVKHVASLNGVAPGPGPISAPGLETTDGALSGYTGDPFTLAGPGVQLAAPVVASRDGFVLYRTPTRWHLEDAEQNTFTDGWATSPIGYTYFPRGGPGTVIVSLSRTAYRGPGKPAVATIRTGTVRLDSNGVPQLDKIKSVAHAVVRNGHRTVVRVHVDSTPVTVVVTMPTFTTPQDSRRLAAQPSFAFVRDGR
jgi:hypothetical protein